MKKLLVVNKNYAPDIGGVESVVKKYASFSNDNYDITVLCCSKSFTLKTKKEYIDGIRVVRTSSFGTYFSMPISFSFIYQLLKLSKNNDIVHAHYPFPLFDLFHLFIPKSKPIILTWHSDIFKQKRLKKIFSYFTKRLLDRSTITVTSLPLKNNSEFLKLYNNVEILPLSFSCNNKLNEIQCDDLGRELPDKFVLFQGRFSYYKGLKVLLQSYKDFKESELLPLVLSGHGDLFEFAKEFVKNNDLSDNIFFIGRYVSEEEKNWLFNKCSFFVFPSIHPSEAFGIVQLEAMSQGKAVINTNLSTGVPWVSIHSETGITVKLNCSISLGKAILELSSNKELREKYGKNAFKRYQVLFSDNEAKTKYLSLLSRVSN